jgi:aminomethyltransferase
LKDLKRTPFFDIHRELGAKIVPFGGFEMPLFYSSIIEEHRWVRKSAGVFDVSHMGEIEIKGRDSLKFVSYVTSNNPASLKPFEVQYSTILNENGGIVDDLLVYRLDEGFLLVVNASNTKKDYEWLLGFATKFDVEIRNISDEVAELAFQGPLSEEVLQKLVNFPLKDLGYYRAARGKVKGRDALISRTGYTGEDGFEIYLDPSDSKEILYALLDFEEVKPAGLGARDTLRMEMGYCLYGNDIDETTNPFEARLGWIVKMEKGNFVGREALLKIKERGIKRKRVGFETDKKGVFPRPHQKISRGEEVVGEVTSGGYSPSLNRGIGMGYVEVKSSKPDTLLTLHIRDRKEEVRIVKLPFYKMGSVKSH